ncbi:hypothetical protein I5M27_00115 [Adhaeribacter sp. BT258]|uniref:Uncharacterized protein n=1 Tax=Adhaeribacter terrigena TaxID=2793070 RepID=A0ABS1BW91_9BACT|nr:hypothetical protein [Adhaeribacter terrigena]MBK0401367.1 hypothetical protein [Adhaeribacter terrigena]
MKKPLSPILLFLLFALLFTVPAAVQAQTNMQLKFVRDLPENLFSARTAVLIGYASNVETTSEEDARIISKFSTQLLTDNQRLGIQMLHFADKNVLLQPAKKRLLLRQYDSLKIENLLLLDITDIKGTGAVGSYVLTHTAFNRRVTLTSPNQKAFVLQAETYEKLIQNFIQATKQYGPNYFEKGPDITLLKPVLTTEPNPQTLPAGTQTSPAKPAKPLAYPLISRTAEDVQRGNGGPTRNFYYYLGADQREKNAGFFGQHLRKDIAASPEALQELNKYRNYKIGYLAERAVFVSAVILYANEVLQDEGYVYFNDRQKVYLGIAAGSLLVNVLILRNTNQHMLRAIDEYNAFATINNNSGFYKLKPSGFGFGTFYNRKVVPGLTLNWQLR